MSAYVIKSDLAYMTQQDVTVAEAARDRLMGDLASFVATKQVARPDQLRKMTDWLEARPLDWWFCHKFDAVMDLLRASALATK